MKVLTTIFLLVFSLLSYGSEDLSKTTYIYHKATEGQEKPSQTSWVLEQKKSQWLLNGESLGGKTQLIAGPTQTETQSFSYVSKHSDNQYRIHREGNSLQALRKTQEGKIEKHFPLNGEAWVQEFDFSFRPFIRSKCDEFKFCIVHPKKLSLHHMVAYKLGTDPITIHEKTFQALKVKVTLRGLKKLFWHADLWFDPKSGDLLKYQANEGPNTPTSTITLISKEVD